MKKLLKGQMCAQKIENKYEGSVAQYHGRFAHNACCGNSTKEQRRDSTRVSETFLKTQ